MESQGLKLKTNTIFFVNKLCVLSNTNDFKQNTVESKMFKNVQQLEQKLMDEIMSGR